MRQVIIWVGAFLAAALMTFAAVSLTQPSITEDLTRRSQETLKSIGHDWAQVSIAGRDARLSGAAPNGELVKDAIAAVSRVAGVRLVENATTIAPPKPPVVLVPTFELVREGRAVAISGTVSDELARKVIRDAVVAALPDATLTDKTVLASGIPALFVTHAAFAAGEAVKLDPASAQIRGNALVIQGKSASFAVYDGVISRLRQPPTGLVVVRQDILAPTVRPFTSSLQFDGKSLILDGFISSEQVRRDLLQQLAQRFPGVVITDNLRQAEGAPRDALTSMTFALEQLSRMKSGSARFSDQGLVFEGDPPDRMAYVNAINAFSGALPAGLRLTSATIRLPTISPYRWSFEKSASGGVIQGYVPSDTVKDILTGAVRRAAGSVALRDEQALALGAPEGFESALVTALRQFEKLTAGRLTLLGHQLSVSGVLRDGADLEAVRSALNSLSGAGLSVVVDLTAPPVATPAAVAIVPAKPVLTVEANQCQDRLKRLVDERIILFDNGKDTVSSDSLPVLDEVSSVLKDCKISSLTVEGHTDNVGSAGFNLTLSQARAQAVKTYLVSKGLSDALLQTEGFGETKPVADNATDEGRARNRRIEFTVNQ